MNEILYPQLSHDDLALAFDLAPVGLFVARERVIQRCNEAFGSMFGYSSSELQGRSTSRLYPSISEYENIATRGVVGMRETGTHSDERIMRHRSGRLFWCHVVGRSLDKRDPFACAVWMFEDISARRLVTADLTVREREIVQYLVIGQASKQIARQLGISPRTVEAHRARLMKKFGVTSHTELISRLVGVE